MAIKCPSTTLSPHRLLYRLHKAYPPTVGLVHSPHYFFPRLKSHRSGNENFHVLACFTGQQHRAFSFNHGDMTRTLLLTRYGCWPGALVGNQTRVARVEGMYSTTGAHFSHKLVLMISYSRYLLDCFHGLSCSTAKKLEKKCRFNVIYAKFKTERIFTDNCGLYCCLHRKDLHYLP